MTRLRHQSCPGAATLALTLDWEAGQGRTLRNVGTSRHEILLTWRPPLDPAGWSVAQDPSGVYDGQFPRGVWAYTQVLRWACEWAAGAADAKAICDACLRNLPSSGLMYAYPAWDVGTMLAEGGGYCGAMSRLLLAMGGAHGIELVRRNFYTDWRDEPLGEVRWNAIVVASPGLNRSEPEEGASTFHDVDGGSPATGNVTTRRERRYRFWGLARNFADGHSIALLPHDGDWYVYDGCFFTDAVRIRGFTVPRPSRTALPIDALGDFKQAYLERAVPWMLGSLLNHGKLYRSVHQPNQPTRNGLTPRTSLLPAGGDTITFYWTA